MSGAAVVEATERRSETIPESRAIRRLKRRQADLGPSQDPIRQQGRDAAHAYHAGDWFASAQPHDRSRLANRRRLYHRSYATSSGHTFDHHFEQIDVLARELEAAGVNLGWGGCFTPGATSVRGSVETEIDRRHLEPRANTAYARLLARKKCRGKPTAQEPASGTNAGS